MSISQYSQDKYVIKHLGAKPRGFFVDIGAHDGMEFSNTYRLEQEYGWSGVLVECNPATNILCKVNRKSPVEEKAVWSESGKFVDFKSCQTSEMLSGIKETLHYDKALRTPGTIYRIETISLNDLLDKYNCPSHIDYMSMDIEGAEYNVLSAYDFSRTFGILSIEHRNDKDLIYELMDKHGYAPRLDYWCTDLETIFVRKP